MILSDPKRQLPEEMTDDWLIDLWDHARELGLNGNPGGFGLTIDLFPFVGVELNPPSGEEVRYLLPYSEWDYDGMREWIAENREKVLSTWQRYVAGGI